MGKDFTSASREDNVYTPYSMTRQFLEKEYFDYDRTFLEPCCGDGAILKVLDELCCYCSGSDLPIDFLSNFYAQGSVDYIITNPPYSKLDQFIIKAKQIATKKFSFLCKITHLGGFERFSTGIFKNPNYPLTKIYMFTRQANLKFTDKYRTLREDGKYPAGMYYYVWLVWENKKLFWEKYNTPIGYQTYNPPTFHWINNQDYILRSK